LIVGKNLVDLPTCHSTNDIARELIHQSPPQEGTVVITGVQTAGKGLRGNAWQVEPHQNLTFSVILYPTWLAPTQAFDLTLAMSLGVLEALQTLGLAHAQIKWPNDVYLSSGKVGGMLIEPTWSGNTCSSCVVGIGLNINQFQWPLPRATSLAKETGKTWSLSFVLTHLLESLDRSYQAMMLPEFRSSALKRYYQHLIGFEQLRRYQANGQSFWATLQGVDPWGRLALIDTAGTSSYYDVKEVEFCWD